MSVPVIDVVRLGGLAPAPTLLLGPSLGTSVQALWGEVAAPLADHFTVIGWELPGHGHGRPTQEGFTVAELAEAVEVALAAHVGEEALHYAGDSLGGCVGLQLALQAPDRLLSLTVLSSGAVIGTPRSWRERAETVRRSGTASLVASSAERWFAPDFASREPGTVSALLHGLRDADDESYALACDALAGLDLTSRLGDISTPLLAVAGAADRATPVATVRQVADGVVDGVLHVLDDVGHLPPAEAPSVVADLIARHAGVVDE